MLSKLVIFFTQKVCNILKILFGNNEWVWPNHRIPFLKNYDTNINFELKNPFFKKQSYSYSLLKSLILLSKKLHEKTPFSLVRLGDSEMLFMDGKMVGNIVKRSFLTNDVSQFDLNLYREFTLKNDFVSVGDIYFLKKFLSFDIPKEKQIISVECVYQLIASKLLFYVLNGYKVGVIGAYEKIEIIKKLMSYAEYREYLGLNRIIEYIQIPQKGASKDYIKTMSKIEEQISGRADVYLVGISVAKLIILPKLRDKYCKVFIDIGVGIDAIAGVIPNTKPFFGNWVNYKLRDFDYSRVNFFSDQKHAKKNIENIKFLN